MPGVDQYQKLLHEVADGRRQAGTSERDGSIHQVWSKDGEQKVRVNMGIQKDGTPWLSPWLHTEDHQGAHRQEEKYRVGMNVKVSTVGGDFRQAKVTPSGHNTKHPAPDHADEKNHTYQNDTLRERHGQDFQENWIAKESTDPSDKNAKKLKDPDKDSVVLVRAGNKPQDQQDKGEPWDGPDTHGGKPKGVYLIQASEKIVFKVGNSTITMEPDKITHASTTVATAATQDITHDAKTDIVSTAQNNIKNEVTQGTFKVDSQTTINNGLPTGWDTSGR